MLHQVTFFQVNRGDRKQFNNVAFDNDYTIIFMDGFQNADDFGSLQNAITSLTSVGVTVRSRLHKVKSNSRITWFWRWPFRKVICQ